MVMCSRFTRLARTTSEPDISPAMWRALSIIAEYGELRVTTLARIDQLTQPTATAIVARLAAEDLVVRVPDPADGRASLIRITAAGTAQLATLRRQAADRLAPLVASLPAQDRATLARATELLDRMTTQQPGTRRRTPDREDRSQ